MNRDLNLNDLATLEKYALFPIENLRNKPMVLQRAFEDDKGLIGAVIVNRTLEVSIIFNGERRHRDKVQVLKCIPNLLIRELVPQGYRDAHVFITDSIYAEILVKHFGFEHVVGQALVRRV